MNLDFGELRKSVPSVHVANGALGMMLIIIIITFNSENDLLSTYAEYDYNNYNYV